MRSGDTRTITPWEAFADVMRGNRHVTVTILAPAKGRDPVKDAVAITRQVVAFLNLPVTHLKPYPSPTARQ